MNRRTVLQILSTATGGAIVSAGVLSNCQKTQYTPRFFAKEDLSLLNEIGETILPQTPDSPGAKALDVATFMDVMVADCFTLEHQEVIRSGLANFKGRCDDVFGNGFRGISDRERHDLLVDIDEEARLAELPHYFALIKSLVLFIYFTSEEVATGVLRYLPIPGKYVGDYPLKEGEKAWAI